MNVKKSTRKPSRRPSNVVKRPRAVKSPRREQSSVAEIKRLRKELAEVKSQRDAYALEISRRLITDDDPIVYSKEELFAMIGAKPTVRELIDQLARSPRT